MKKASKAMLKNILWVKDQVNNPLIYDEKVKEYLRETGSIYVYGFDHCFRPITIIRPKLINKEFLNDSDLMRNVLNRVVSFLEERIFVRGKSESTVLLIDVEKLGYFDLKDIIVNILKILENQKHLITRIYRIYFLNISTSFKMMKTFSLPFVSDYLNGLVKYTTKNTHEEMEDHINPHQLEMKYGGDQPNLEKGDYW